MQLIEKCNFPESTLENLICSSRILFLSFLFAENVENILVSENLNVSFLLKCFGIDLVNYL